MLTCQAAAFHMVTIPRDAAGGDYSDVHTCQNICYTRNGQLEQICYVTYTCCAFYTDAVDCQQTAPAWDAIGNMNYSELVHCKRSTDTLACVRKSDSAFAT